MKKFLGVIAAAGLMVSQPTMAFEFDQENLYAGGGLGSNGLDVSGASPDRAIGWQVFAGYDLADLELADGLKTAVEVGYMTTGDFEYSVNLGILGTQTVTLGSLSGLWATGVFAYPVADQVEVIGRIGLDFGDDDGLMFGGGAGYQVNDEVDVRAEYVLRKNIDSLLISGVYHF